MKYLNLSWLSILSCKILNAKSDQRELETLINRLNFDIIELRNEMESSNSMRCETITGCRKSSYDECQSEMSLVQTCPSVNQLGYYIEECGLGESCNALFDYGATTVRLSENLTPRKNRNPSNPSVIEAVCSSRMAEKWMFEKYNDDKSFWRNLGVDSPQMYFGSTTGMFRIYPARHSRECGQYDPRERPWYKNAVPSTVSNTVNPRRVVILMDTSLSMNDFISERSNQRKLDYMKSVVSSILMALVEQDSVAVLRYDEDVSILGTLNTAPPYVWQHASNDYIEKLINEIFAIEAVGRSNLFRGFDVAFDLIDVSLEEYINTVKSACHVENIALMLFSDGGTNIPAEKTNEQIVQFVASRVNATESKGDFHVHTFLYSLGNPDPQQLAKNISCAVDGFWKPLSEEAASNATSGYEALFSTPMGTDYFYNFTTWSDPYIFTSAEKLGYTVSALVYNRNVSPPRFLGAVGMDILLSVAQNLYGGTEDETQVAIKRVTDNITVNLYNVSCEQRRINLTYCEIQSLRYFSGGKNSLCVPPNLPFGSEALPIAGLLSNKTSYVDVSAEMFLGMLNCSNAIIPPCQGMDEYPEELWKNVNLQNESYQDRVCCEVGTNSSSDKCPDLDENESTLSNREIFAIISISLLVVEIIGCYSCFYYKKKSKSVED